MLIEQGEDGEGIGLAGAGLFGRHIIEGKRDAIKLRFDLRDDQPGPFYLKGSSGKFIHNYPRHNYGSVRAGIVDGGLLGNGWMSLFGVELGYSTDPMIEYCTSVVNSAGRFGGTVGVGLIWLRTCISRINWFLDRLIAWTNPFLSYS